MAKIIRTPASNNKLLADILDQLKETEKRNADTLERIQQQLAMVNEGANLAPGDPGDRHYA